MDRGVPLDPERLAAAYGTCLAVLALLDAGRVTVVAVPLYRAHLGTLVLDRPSLPAALTFYLLFAAGLLFFAVAPGLTLGSWLIAAACGGAYGLVAYVVYTLSNLTLLRRWTTAPVLRDIGWGALIAACAAAGGYGVARWVG